MTFRFAVTFAVVALGSVCARAPQAAEAGFTSPATPAGVTLQLAKAVGGERPIYYANASGQALYTFAKDTQAGKAVCAGECAALWPPLMAGPTAKPFAAWTIIAREDGTRQWAVGGKPLYTYSKDTKPGDITGNNLGEVWHLAVANAASDVVFP